MVLDIALGPPIMIYMRLSVRSVSEDSHLLLTKIPFPCLVALGVGITSHNVNWFIKNFSFFVRVPVMRCFVILSVSEESG